MEATVDRVAARIRGAFSEALAAIRDQHADETTPFRSARAFAPLASRKRPLGSGASNREIDWRTLLLTLFQRFAGELAVEGKLLNHEEIQVHRLVRVRPLGLETSSTDECYVLDPSRVRFLVRCLDAPISEIGSLVKALSVKGGCRVIPGVVSSLPTVSYLSQTEKPLSRSGTERDISSATSVFGFDAALFTGRASRRPHDPDSSEEEDCDANSSIMRDRTFSDLRGVSRMMEANNLPPRNWACLINIRSNKSTHFDKAMKEEHPWSYVSLGEAQKKLWAKERIERGDSLRRKGRIKECLDEYTSAIRLDEQNSEALLKRGQILMELRQYEDAIHNFERLLDFDPANEQASKTLMRARGKLGYSKRVVTAQFVEFSQLTNRGIKEDAKPAESKGEEAQAPAADIKEAMALEKDRLRRLLEEEERRRRHSRRKSSSRRRDTSLSESGDSSSDTYAESRRGKKSHKRSKKSKKSQDRKRRKKSSRSSDDDDGKDRRRRRRRREESSSSDESGARRVRKSSRSRRSMSRSRSASRSRPYDKTSSSLRTEDQPHPILSRQPHRLWN